MKSYICSLLVLCFAFLTACTGPNDNIQVCPSETYGAYGVECFEGVEYTGQCEPICDSKMLCSNDEICGYASESDPFGFCVPQATTPTGLFSNGRIQLYLCGQISTDMDLNNPSPDMNAD